MMSENLFSPEEEIRIRLQGQGGQGQGQGQGIEGQGQGGQGQGQGGQGQGQGGQGQGQGGQGQGQGGQGQGQGVEGQGQGQGGQGQGQGQGVEGQGQGGQGQGQGQGVEGQGQGQGVEGKGQGQGGQGQGQGQGVEGQGQGQGGQDDDDDDDDGEDDGDDDDTQPENQNEQNDSRIGQKCVVLFPRDVAGLMGTIQEVLFRGVPDNVLEKRNINGYVLQLPRVEYTLFSILVTNLKGENETLPLMDIDIAFSGQNISYVESGRSFQGEVVQFVKAEPNLYLIRVGNLNRLAEHCFITPEQANQQNNNNNNQNDNDADDEEDDNVDTPLDLIPSAFLTYVLRKVWKFEYNVPNDNLGYEDFSETFLLHRQFLGKFLETSNEYFFDTLVDEFLIQNRTTKEIYFVVLPNAQNEKSKDEIMERDIQALQTFLIFYNSLKSTYGDKFLPFMMASALLNNNNSDFIVWQDDDGNRAKLFRFDDLNGTKTICISKGRNEIFFTEYKREYDNLDFYTLGRFQNFDIMDFFAPTNNLPFHERRKEGLQRDMLGYLQAFLI